MRADAIELIEDRPAERRTFRGIGAGAEFIQQNQTVGIRGFED